MSHEVSDSSFSLRKGVECGVCFVSPESVVKTSINKLFKEIDSMHPPTEAHTLISFKVASLYSKKVEDYVSRLKEEKDLDVRK